MARRLKDQINKRHAFASPEEEAMLNVYRTASHLNGLEHVLFKSRGLSAAGYNLLGILRGHRLCGGKSAGVEGVRASEIGCEMVVRMPDVTRLVDRLEKMKLVSRHEGEDDKRVKMVRITVDGLGLLEELEPVVGRLMRDQLGHLSKKELNELSRLLELVRDEDGERENSTKKQNTKDSI